MSGLGFTSGKGHLMHSYRVAIASKGTNPGCFFFFWGGVNKSYAFYI